jgi:hypothetical protein
MGVKRSRVRLNAEEKDVNQKSFNFNSTCLLKSANCQTLSRGHAVAL